VTHLRFEGIPSETARKSRRGDLLLLFALESCVRLGDLRTLRRFFMYSHTTLYTEYHILTQIHIIQRAQRTSSCAAAPKLLSMLEYCKFSSVSLCSEIR
jgi:hypothetical protein